MSKFAEVLTELLLERGLTVAQFNKILGVGSSTANHYVTGRYLPSVPLFVKIADYFGCTADFLLGLEEENYPREFAVCPPFKDRLNALLDYYGVTRYRLQQMTGIAESAMRYWAQGKTLPTMDSVIRIAEALNCSVDFVLGR